jgi:hypothetical protein
MVQPGEANLLEMILALNHPSRFARRLNGRKKQGDQDSDHGNDNQ